MKHRIFSLSGIAAAAIILNSCGHSDNSLTEGIGGPADTAGFAGSTISFNPTLRFRPGGVVEYVNTAELPTLFPMASRTSPAIGTYTYTADAGFLTGTLSITFPTLAGGVSEIIPITEFVSTDGYVRAFTMNFDDEGPFVARVTSGEIISAGTKTGSGGGGGGPGNQFTFGEDGNIVAGTTFTKNNTSTLYAGFYGGGTLTYSPLEVHAVGQAETFTISGSGSIQFGGVDRKGSFFGGGLEPYTLDIPFVGSSNGILSYRGVDARSGGTMVVTFDTVSTNILTIRWDDNFFSDYEQQSFQ